jgi:hypothetical protein
MRRSAFFAVALAVALLHVVASAQSPHGGPAARPVPGPNVNAAAGIVANPADPAALVKSDLLLQRQNETVIAGSNRNPDHLLAAANDYRFVDFPQDQFLPDQGFLTRLLAKIFGRTPGRAAVPARATVAVGAWTGIYRSCDRGATWIGSALPGSPLDASPASLASPLKALSNTAEMQGGHAETTDPTLVAGPGGRMHVIVLGFVRFPDGTVGDSRVYYTSYTDLNNREGGGCFKYDFTVEVDRAGQYLGPKATSPFIDKPSMAVDKDGSIYVAYTVFSDAINSKVIVARSTDGGGTWSKSQPNVQQGFLKNHGTTMAIDPLDGTLYVAWRVFYEGWPLMVISRSPNGAKTFLPPSPISDEWPGKNLSQIVQKLKGSKLQPFDQFSNEVDMPPTARALAFPHLVAGVVNGQTRLFVVWQERADVNPASPTFGLPSATGSPRAMLSISTDANTWTLRRAVDAGPRNDNSMQTGPPRPSGPQLHPVLNISGTTNPELLLAYYESRTELNAPYEINFLSGATRRLDVRVARLDPATGLLRSPSVQVSQYPVQANSETGALAEIAPGYSVANRPNLKMYSAGTKPFIGDYLALSSSRAFEWNGSWRWAVEPASALGLWTDNRDVGFPLNTATGLPDINGNWASYTPLKVTPPGAAPATCGSVGLRNANPYFSEIAGVVAGSPQTFKPLTIQRAFVTYVANRTAVDRTFRLTIVDNEATGLDAAFTQFSAGPADDVRDVTIFANSTNTQTVWVQPFVTNPAASVRVQVDEINAPGGTMVTNGLKTAIVLNPDPNNAALTNVPSAAPGFESTVPSINSHELHNPQISTPQISTFPIRAPQISSPQISTPQISTPQISTPQISTPQISTPQISTPQISTPQISTPQISTPQISTVSEENGTDVTYTANNLGNTWSAYSLSFNVPNVENLIGSGTYQFQVLVTRTSLEQGYVQTAGGCVPAAVPRVQVLANVPVPAVAVPQISTISDPGIDDGQTAQSQIVTFALAPVGGVMGQNAGDPGVSDLYSTILPDEVKITLRAIRLKPASDPGPVFVPTEVTVKVASVSTNVVAGVPQPPGSEPEVIGSPSGAFLSTPDDGFPNVPLTPVVRVRARDLTGAPLSGVIVTLSLSTNPTSAILSNNVATTNESGIAQFPLLQVDRVGTGYVLEATAGTTVLGHSAPFNINPAPIAVTSAADSGPGTLRQAILDANANAPALDTITFNISGSTLITLASALPQITDGVHIDGTSQPGFASGTRVRVHGAAAVNTGFVVGATGGGSAIRGLVITGFTVRAIQLDASGNTVASNYIGLVPTGAAVPNGEGVFVNATTNNTIGGASASDRNVISGNTGHGVRIVGGFDATGNTVFNNYIGTNGAGTGAVPNGGNGVLLIAPSTVGGAGAGNVISGNTQNGIAISQDDSESVVQGNMIGTNAAGTAAVGNGGNGITIGDTEFSVIGGTNAGEGNVISGNAGNGIVLSGDASATTVQGNHIGMNAAGTGAIPNAGNGVSINGTFSTMLGGTTAAARNLISANGGNGVVLDDSRNNDVVGNYIGTDITGLVDFGNGGHGVNLRNDSDQNRVGGAAAGSGNLISENDMDGVAIDATSDRITILGNSIHSNGGLGIDLTDDDVTANEPQDLDTGANDLQNFPDVFTAVTSGTITGNLHSSINATFVVQFFSSPICSPLGNGEGATVLGSTTINSDGAGNAPFIVSFGSLTAGQVVTATATDALGNTSEFSTCVTVIAGHGPEAPTLASLRLAPPRPSRSLDATSESAMRSSGAGLETPPGIRRERVARLGAPAYLEK